MSATATTHFADKRGVRVKLRLHLPDVLVQRQRGGHCGFELLEHARTSQCFLLVQESHHLSGIVDRRCDGVRLDLELFVAHKCS